MRLAETGPIQFGKGRHGRRRYRLEVWAAGARLLTADRLTWGALTELLDEHWPAGARAELHFSCDA